MPKPHLTRDTRRVFTGHGTEGPIFWCASRSLPHMCLCKCRRRVRISGSKRPSSSANATLFGPRLFPSPLQELSQAFAPRPLPAPTYPANAWPAAACFDLHTPNAALHCCMQHGIDFQLSYYTLIRAPRYRNASSSHADTRSAQAEVAPRPALILQKCIQGKYALGTLLQNRQPDPHCEVRAFRAVSGGTESGLKVGRCRYLLGRFRRHHDASILYGAVFAIFPRIRVHQTRLNWACSEPCTHARRLWHRSAPASRSRSVRVWRSRAPISI